MKTAETNPELIIVGQKCKVLMPTYWVGAQTDEPNVWLPAKIIGVNYDKDNSSEISSIILDVRASHKYHTVRIEHMMSLKNQFNQIKF